MRGQPIVTLQSNRGIRPRGKLRDRRFYELREVVIRKPNQFVVRARIEYNLFLLCEILIDKDRHLVEFAERWHSPGFAFGKHIPKLRLCREGNLFSFS